MNNKQYVILVQIRKNRINKALSDYKKSTDRIEVENKKIKSTECEIRNYKVHLNNTIRNYRRDIKSGNTNIATMDAWRVSIVNIENSISNAEKTILQCIKNKNKLQADSQFYKKNYRKSLLAFEKIKLVKKHKKEETLLH